MFSEIGRRYTYDCNRTVVLDQFGNGTITNLDSPRIGYMLRLDGGNVTVRGGGTPTVAIYKNLVTDTNRIAITTTGDTVTLSGDGRSVFYPGEQPVVQFSGGSPGGQCSVRMTGLLEAY
jgi:hypothetical protein